MCFTSITITCVKTKGMEDELPLSLFYRCNQKNLPHQPFFNDFYNKCNLSLVFYLCNVLRIIIFRGIQNKIQITNWILLFFL